MRIDIILLAALIAGCATDAPESVKAGDAKPVASVKPQPAKKLTLAQRLKADFAEARKDVKGFDNAKAVQLWREVRMKECYATNAAARLEIASSIVGLCRMPHWMAMRSWKAELEDEIPVETKPILADKSYTLAQKLPFAVALVRWQAGVKEDFAAARQTLDDLRTAFPNAKGKERCDLEIAYANLYRWQDDFPAAWAAIERAAGYDALVACRKASQLARETDDWTRAAKLWRTKRGEFDYINSSGDPAVRVAAEAFVRKTSNPVDQRATVVTRHFSGKTPLDREMRSLMKPKDLVKCWTCEGPIIVAYQFGDYAHAVELLDFFKEVPCVKNPKPERCRCQIVALAAVGRREEAVKMAAAHASDGKAKPMDRAKFRVLHALLTGGDVGKVIAESGFTGLQASELWRTAARQSLVLDDGKGAEKYAAAYSACFAASPKRRLRVPYVDDPIASAADWRRLRDRLDSQLCDLPYGLDLKDMVTDVATGREEIKASAFDNESVRAEISAVCDRNGFHLFIRAADPSAAAVRDGFSGGVGSEVYFAPGKDAPYTYFYVSPVDGVKYSFQTMYNNALATRPDVDHRKGRSFGCDCSFSDDDYVAHVFIGWDTLYNRMPTDGSVWVCDVIARSASGAHSWAGSQHGHERSSWGELVFSLKPEEVTAIRRAALCHVKRTWRQKGRLDVFDIWRDWSIGDAKFYAEVLAPLEEELAAGMAGVKPDMTDEEVNRIFDSVFIRCAGLKHEIDRLRRDWLQKQLTK